MGPNNVKEMFLFRNNEYDLRGFARLIILPRRVDLCIGHIITSSQSIDLFDEIVCNPTHNLHSLLPQRKSCKYALRRKSDFTLPLCKTERLKNSFIFSHVYKM